MSIARARSVFLAPFPLLLLALGMLAAPARAAAPSPAYGTRGMVVASETEAARAGRSMFERGGNAVDAAIATAFALAVTQPFSAGLGGSAFILIRTGLGEIIAIDARETAPAAASRDMFQQPGVPEGASLMGPLAVATPGFVAGCAVALERWGTLPLDQVLAPAIELAERGFAIGPYHARMIEAMRGRGLAQRFPETARIQFPPDGKPARPGWRLVQRDLAATLRRFASAEGTVAFYRGDLADAIAAAVQSRGGILTREDLAAYQPVLRDPVVGSYRGYTVFTFPPPSSGGLALVQALNILEGMNLAPLGAGSSASVHRIAEALKLSFADTLAFVGDPDFVSVPASRLTAKPYAQKLRARLDPELWWRRAPWDWFDGEQALRVPGPGLRASDAGTTHLSTSDGNGNAVALTMTINTPYGSGITAEGTGVLLNNEMDDFAIAPDLPNTYGVVDPRGANAIAPRKRPRSSMTPTILEKDGRLFMVTGSPGGPRIISTTLLSVVNVIDYGMDPSEAVSAPRFHHQWEPNVLYLEPATPRDVVDALRERGHEVKVEQHDWSAAEAIVYQNGVFWGGSDPRRDGLAAGY
jgi:gamma-glutamyltranspeptidase/glutathione hydrolase